MNNNPQRPARILIFDSGVGGLSIFAEIKQQYPACQLFYASDNGAFPYGPKPEQELTERVDSVLSQLQQHTQADIIVIACNTASTIALPRIRERFQLPIIGVVPAIKPAAQLSQSQVIGLLATPGTIQRDYTEQLIKEFANQQTIIRIGSTELVQLAEQKLRGHHISEQQLAPIVADFTQYAELDTVVLACTHFPLIKVELQRVLPDIAYWVDSGAAIARRVGYWLQQLKLHSPAAETLNIHHKAYFTLQDKTSEQLAPALARFGIAQIAYLDKATYASTN